MQNEEQGKVSDNNSEQGATMLEYVLLALLIAVASLTAVQYFGKTVSVSLSQTAEAIASTN